MSAILKLLNYLEGFGDKWRKQSQPERFESWLKKEFEATGHLVLRSGWPDFVIISPTEKPFCVEAKQGHDKLRPNQITMRAALVRGGMKVYCIRGDEKSSITENDLMFTAVRERDLSCKDFDGLGVS
jgi:hypothetical protein